MHLFHKWCEVLAVKGTVIDRILNTKTGIKSEVSSDFVGVIEKCKKCNKERAYITNSQGEKTFVHPLFIKESLSKKEPLDKKEQ